MIFPKAVINEYQFILEEKHVLLLLITSLTIGLICGAICKSNWFNSILANLNFSRTTNENIWDDLLKHNTFVRVYNDDNTSYYGAYIYCEEFEREPIIVLTQYQILDENAEVIIDNWDNEDEKVVLNLKDFKRVEITYASDKKNK